MCVCVCVFLSVACRLEGNILQTLDYAVRVYVTFANVVFELTDLYCLEVISII